jgi:hypothetical protein
MRAHRLFTALLAFDLLAFSAQAESANVLDPASRDCSDPEALRASVNQSLLSDAAQSFQAAFEGAPEQRSVSVGDPCSLHGSGAFSYCAGECTKAGTTCADLIPGRSCVCKKVVTQ